MTTQTLHPDILARIAENKLTVEEGQDLKPSQFNLADLKFKPFFKESGDHYITGKEMREHVINMKGNLGLADVKNLLDQLNNHPDKRKDLQDKCIILPAIVLRNSGDRLGAAYICWGGDLVDSWELRFISLDVPLSVHCLFACTEPACR